MPSILGRQGVQMIFCTWNGITYLVWSRRKLHNEEPLSGVHGDPMTTTCLTTRELLQASMWSWLASRHTQRSPQNTKNWKLGAPTHTHTYTHIMTPPLNDGGGFILLCLNFAHTPALCVWANNNWQFFGLEELEKTTLTTPKTWWY